MLCTTPFAPCIRLIRWASVSTLVLLLFVCLLPAQAAAQSYDITEQCFAVANERSTPAGKDSQDTLVRLNRTTAQSFVIGLTGTRNIEAIAFDPDGILYAVDGGQLGTLALDTGLFSPLPSTTGIGDGSAGVINLNDVDGLTYDLEHERLYATHRRGGGLSDLLFVIDQQSGAHVSDFFGPNIDYVEVSILTDDQGRLLDDVDDIAIDPVTGVMYGAINRGGAGGELAIIDRTTGVATRVATFRYPDPNPANPVTSGEIIDDIEGLAFFNDGQLYGSTGNNGPDQIDLNQLFRLDKATGSGVSVGPFPSGHMDYEAVDCLTARAFVVLEKFTNGPGRAPVDADEPTGPTLQVGEPVTWTYQLVNTGALTLTDLVLQDDQVGLIGPDGVSNCPPRGASLGPGEELSCTATGSAQPGQYANRATITALTQVELITPRQTVTDSDPSHYFGESPAIDLQKLTNGQDADDPNGSDVPQIAPGSPVTWTYIVTNTGNVAFNESAVIVSDDQVSATLALLDKGDGDNLLAPGEVWRYQATGSAVDLFAPDPTVTVVPGCDPGGRGPLHFAYRNIGQVVADSAAAFDPSHYCNPPRPAIAIEKLTNGEQANGENDSDVPQIAPGDPVTWTYIVRNIGDLPFAEAAIAVVDDHLGVITTIVDKGDGDAILAPDESWIYEVVGLAADLSLTPSNVPTIPGCDAAQTGNTRPTYRNLGTVTAGPVTDANLSHYCNPPAPALNIQKLTNGQNGSQPNDPDVPQLTPGATVTWTYLVTNTGSVALNQSEITVRDDVLGVITQIVHQGDGDTLLAPGEVWIYQAVGTAANLATTQAAAYLIPGCDPTASGQTRPTYRNIGAVQARTAVDLDASHYCNLAPTALDTDDEPNQPNQPNQPTQLRSLFLPFVYYHE